MKSIASAPDTSATSWVRTGAKAATKTGLRALTRRFQTPTIASSAFQVATSFGGFLAICVLMYVTAAHSLWLTLALSVVAGGFLVRVFIVQHDCGHDSFFRSRTANRVLGIACSLLTLTPFQAWKRQHAGHHGNWNNLDRREAGVDIYSSCLTVDEYRALGPWQRRWHRFSHHPLMTNILLPPLVFLLLYRFPFDTPKRRKSERRSIHLTNAMLVAAIVGLGFLFGFDRVALVHLPIIVVGSIIGVWLFSVQHCFERVKWRHQAEWTAEGAAIEGSSHLDLPRVLHWFTGNIGFHHVHHLNPKVPNYRLRACHHENPELQTAPRLGLLAALGQWRFALWDELQGRMVGYREAMRQPATRQPATQAAS